MTVYKGQLPIVTAVCKEPEGIIVRSVYSAQLSPEFLQRFWEKARKFKTVFSVEVRDDFKAFCELFISQEGDNFRSHGLFWVVDDYVGVFYMTHITQTDAQVHYTFFDRRHHGREELTKEMLRHVFRRFGFWRLTVEIPDYVSIHTYGFVSALGFKKEGRKRKSVEFKDVRRDVFTYGLLREEILDGNEV